MLNGVVYFAGHGIVASFIVNKSVSLLEDNKLQLVDEIFDEIDAPSSKVPLLIVPFHTVYQHLQYLHTNIFLFSFLLKIQVGIWSLEPLPGANKTRVIFTVDPDDKYTEMSSAVISLIRASFTSLVIRQSILQLTSSSLFGDPYSFEVLKFKGGITIIPQQKAFPLQKGQAQFSFKLNFPIHQIQSNFVELTNQLKSGLYLTSFEVCLFLFFSLFMVIIYTPSILGQLSVLIICYVSMVTTQLLCKGSVVGFVCFK